MSSIRDFQYIVAIAETGSFSKAAELCHVSQSTLSIQIKKYEEYLHIQLFERTNKSVMLTRIGRLIYEQAKKILLLSEEIKSIAKYESDPFSGTLTIGAFPTLSPYLFPLCAGEMKKKLPNIHFQLVEEKTNLLLEQLQQGKMDCIIVAEPIDKQGYKSVFLFDEPFYLAIHPSHALAEKTLITDSELAEHPLLLLDEGHCLREHALSVCSMIGGAESQQFRATSLETLRQMVAMNEAITLIPKLAIQKNDAAILYKPFKNTSFSRRIILLWRETSSRTACFMQLATIISTLINARLMKNHE